MAQAKSKEEMGRKAGKERPRAIEFPQGRLATNQTAPLAGLGALTQAG